MQGAPRLSSEHQFASKESEAWLEARVELGLPARGRRVLGRAAMELLLEQLPRWIENALMFPGKDSEVTHQAWRHVCAVENHAHLQAQLKERGIVAFVADGSNLPRESGDSDRPLKEARLFAAPESLRVELSLRHPQQLEGKSEAASTIRGMGIPFGVTLIVGGGFHGKTTLLEAIQSGVYPHIPGDGRELVVTDKSALKIRAENGRRVASVNISPFIRNLPLGRDTECFESLDASGSTSQAASLVEAVEMGVGTLLIDEDTSATNFMIRDARMQALIPDGEEPIRPLVDWIRRLSQDIQLSSILILGGSGDYLDQADTIVRMVDYEPTDVTARAREIAAAHPTGRVFESQQRFERSLPRKIVRSSVDPSRGSKSVSIDAPTVGRLRFGRAELDLSLLEQLVDRSQARAIGEAIHFAFAKSVSESSSRGSLLCIRDTLDALDARLDEKGLDLLSPHGGRGEHPGRLARPRIYEIAAAINRLRSLHILPGTETGNTVGAT